MNTENQAEAYRKMQAAWEKVLREFNTPESHVKLLLWGIASRFEHLGQRGAVILYFEEDGSVSLRFWNQPKLHELEMSLTKQAELTTAVEDYDLEAQVVCLAVWDTSDPELRRVEVLTVTVPNLKAPPGQG